MRIPFSVATFKKIVSLTDMVEYCRNDIDPICIIGNKFFISKGVTLFIFNLYGDESFTYSINTETFNKLKKVLKDDSSIEITEKGILVGSELIEKNPKTNTFLFDFIKSHKNIVDSTDCIPYGFELKKSKYYAVKMTPSNIEYYTNDKSLGSIPKLEFSQPILCDDDFESISFEYNRLKKFSEITKNFKCEMYLKPKNHYLAFKNNEIFGLLYEFKI